MTDTSVRPAAETQLLSPLPRRTARPSWLDTRLVLGVALVLVAVLLGATVVSRADRRTAVWSFSHDLAAGTVLRVEDLTPVRVQLGAASGRYVAASDAVVGRAVRHDVTGGELLSRAELEAPRAGVTVTIPVRLENAPRLDRGARLTIWLSSKYCRGVTLLSGVAVQDVRAASGSSFGASGTVGLVLSVPGADAQRVIAALDADGAVVRVGILGVGETPAQVGRVDACLPAAK